MSHFLEAAINFTGVKSYENIYRDVYIDTKTSAVLDSNLNPIYETLYEIIFWWKGTLHGQNLINPELRKVEVARRYEEIKEEIDTISQEDVNNAKVLNDDVEAIYAMGAHGWYPYGHLHDALLRLFPWREHVFKNPKVLVSKYNRVVDFPLHLAAFGYAEDTIFRTAPKYRLIKAKTLYFGVNEARFWTTSSQRQYEWMLQGYLNLFEKSPHTMEPIEGLYLSRNHVGRRGVSNDAQVSQFLGNKGFRTLTGNEGLMEIIELFARAKTIVGPHGSIFVNTIFCRADTKVIEYCPNNRVDKSFLNKTKLVEDYQHILLEADCDFNLMIDLEDLDERLGF